MDSYLLLAEKIFERALTPLSAKEILRLAYLENILPSHLYGKTQHKTLQARISTDIRSHGEKSKFYRVEPGVFFLNSLRNLPDLTDDQRKGIIARPRFRELQKEPVLGILKTIFKKKSPSDEYLYKKQIFNVLQYENIAYKELENLKGSEFLPLWTLLVVLKDDKILTYRHGRYRENRDGFVHQKTIGFRSLLTTDDATIFERKDLGLVSAGLKAAFVDLGIPLSTVDVEIEKDNTEVEFLTLIEQEDELVCVITYNCPDWLEPLKRRLAINNLGWSSATHIPNNLEDFDDWSKKIIPKLFSIYREKRGSR